MLCPDAGARNPDGDRLASGQKDGTVVIQDMRSGREVSLRSGHGGSWLAMNRDGYFSGFDDGTMVAVAQGNRTSSVEQLAPARNRPDKILTDLGAPSERVVFYTALWHRRLRRLGLTPQQVSESFLGAPSVRIFEIGTPNASGKAPFRLSFRDTVGLQGYQVYVNGVPINAQLIPLEGKRQRLTIEIQLTKENNHIEISRQGGLSLMMPRQRPTPWMSSPAGVQRHAQLYGCPRSVIER